jgi:hypothetical protein
VNVIAILSGGLVGFTLGLVGGGGSVLATPLLLYAIVGLPPHVAIGTGAFAVSVNAFLNFAAQFRSGRIVWKVAILFAVLGSFGAFVGSTLGKAMNGDQLIFIFGLAMLGVGAAMLRPVEPKRDSKGEISVSMAKSALVAVAVGCLAGFFGIGGGVLIVPGLVLATRMPMLNAISTSLLAVGSFGLTTAVNYAVSGLVDWMIAAQFIGGGLLGGALGIKAGVFLSRYKGALNMAFATLVFVVASYVLYRSGSALFGPTYAPQQAAVERVAEPSSVKSDAEPTIGAPAEQERGTADATKAESAPASKEGHSADDQVPPEPTVPAEESLQKPVVPDVPSTSVEASLRGFLGAEGTREGGVTWFDLDSVRFDAGKTRPQPASEAQLRSIAAILSAHPGARAIVGGHTDAFGDVRKNRRLSELRATSVLRALVRMGVDASRLEARGYAADRPLAASSTAAGRAENRRISLGVTRE